MNEITENPPLLANYLIIIILEWGGVGRSTPTCPLLPYCMRMIYSKKLKRLQQSDLSQVIAYNAIYKCCFVLFYGRCEADGFLVEHLLKSCTTLPKNLRGHLWGHTVGRTPQPTDFFLANSTSFTMECCTRGHTQTTLT